MAKAVGSSYRDRVEWFNKSHPFELCFLGLDGLLADFHRSAFAAHGRPFIEEEYPVGEWAIDTKVLGISPNEFWTAIDDRPNFWRDLAPLPWINQVIALARMLAPTIKILTSPSRSHYCYSGKRKWCDAWIPREIELILCSSKELLAEPGRILIDDSDANCEKFWSHGGRSLLFPRRWNMLHPEWNRPVETIVSHSYTYFRDRVGGSTLRIEAMIEEILGVPLVR